MTNLTLTIDDTVLLSLIIFLIDITRRYLWNTGKLGNQQGRSADCICALLALFGALFAEDIVLRVLFSFSCFIYIFPLFLHLFACFFSRKTVKYQNIRIEDLNESQLSRFQIFADSVLVTFIEENHTIACYLDPKDFSESEIYTFSFLSARLIVKELFSDDQTHQIPDVLSNTKIGECLSEYLSTRPANTDKSPWQISWYRAAKNLKTSNITNADK